MTESTCRIRYELAKAKGDKAEMEIWSSRLLETYGVVMKEEAKVLLEPELKPKKSKK